MVTVEVTKDVKKRLKEYGNGKSINKTMRMLLEDAETVDTCELDRKQVEKTNIYFDDELLVKLKRCKLYRTESHSDTIERLLIEYECNK